jgi:hypothetical protein
LAFEGSVYDREGFYSLDAEGVRRHVQRAAHVRVGLMCRTYRDGEKSADAPLVEMIRAAIRAPLGGESFG